MREQEGEGCGGARGGAVRGHGEPARECEAAAPKRDVGLAELEPRAEDRVLLLRPERSVPRALSQLAAPHGAGQTAGRQVGRRGGGPQIRRWRP